MPLAAAAASYQTEHEESSHVSSNTMLIPDQDDDDWATSTTSSPLHLYSGAASANTSDMTLLISNRNDHYSGTSNHSSNSNYYPYRHSNVSRTSSSPPLDTTPTRRSIFGPTCRAAPPQHYGIYQIDATDRQSLPSPPGSPISTWQRQERILQQQQIDPLLTNGTMTAPAAPAVVNLVYQQQQQQGKPPSCLPETTAGQSFLSYSTIATNGDKQQPPHPSSHKKRHHETVHAQSLLLGLAFCAVWTSTNLMAPNLTQMAVSFDLTTEAQRDLYLGSYCALATNVLSLPLSFVLGICADVTPHHRKWLFCATVAGGALATAGTALSQTYRQLLVSRWASGAFCAASVPVAFSFLGDLFATRERNVASSGLTACMGCGILLGQVYAGTVGDDWQHAFWVSSGFTGIAALLCAALVQEPVRGGREDVLQELLQAGQRYDRKLTWRGFWHALRNNASNRVLLWQGFFSNLPWGVIFVFLNDYLSQERGFSVPDATFLVLVFGVGCAAGGVLGGYWGQVIQEKNRAYLPLFMAFTTAAGILPFLGLLNTHFTNAKGFWGLFWAGSGGFVASLPSVSARPCVLNVNPPETRGASLTAANLLIQLGRGIGPSCVTLMCTMWNFNRKQAFNVTLIVFWLVSAIQLLFLARTLPHDQDKMEAELANYAQRAMAQQTRTESTDSDTIVSIEERITAFDGVAAKETITYVREGFKEIKEELNPFACGGHETSSDEEEVVSSELPTERTQLLIV